MGNEYSGIPQHKRMAMGENVMDAGDFGVDKLASAKVNGPANRMLKDSERGAGPPLEGNQRNPDHGWKFPR